VRKLNILWLVDHLGYGGHMHGAAVQFLNTIPLFDADRYSVTLCVLRPHANLAALFRAHGVNVISVSRNKFDPRTLLDLLKIVRDAKIDLIHAHGYGSTNFGRLAGMMTRVPVIVHAHDDDRNYPWYQALADLALSRATKHAIAVSESVRDAFVSKRRIDRDRVIVMHNAIHLERFETPEQERVLRERERLDLAPGSKVVGTVGRLREEKGTRYLLEAAGRVLEDFPETIFLIAGDGPLRPDLEQLATELEIDGQVVFAGFCDDVPALLAIMEIVVIPSLTEGSPLALLEAMAMGKPIVATYVGGMREILSDGKTGLFVSPRDPASLADKIKWLLGNPAGAQDLGAKGRQESRKYDIGRFVQRLERQYANLIATGTI
jgi:glycosyltransferase involved in cell wall biosynthesis